MLVTSLDIETTGLDRFKCQITVVALIIYDTSTNQVTRTECFNVCLAREHSEHSEQEIKTSVRNILNDSDRLLAFNGVGFDIPWISFWLDGDNSELREAWISKTIDYCLEAKLRLDSFVSMQKVCDDNSVGVSKTASGKQAVIWAAEKQWDKLESYCMADVEVLLALFKMCVKTGLVLKSKKSNARVMIRMGPDMHVQEVSVTKIKQLQYSTATDEQLPAAPTQSELDDIFV